MLGGALGVKYLFANFKGARLVQGGGGGGGGGGGECCPTPVLYLFV